MSMFTEFRDSVVNTVVPNGIKMPTVSDAGHYVGSEIIKIAEPPKGNLTAAQIEKGETGAATQGLSSAKSALKISVPVMILIGVAVYVVMSKKGK